MSPNESIRPHIGRSNYSKSIKSTVPVPGLTVCSNLIGCHADIWGVFARRSAALIGCSATAINPLARSSCSCDWRLQPSHRLDERKRVLTARMKHYEVSTVHETLYRQWKLSSPDGLSELSRSFLRSLTHKHRRRGQTRRFSPRSVDLML